MIKQIEVSSLSELSVAASQILEIISVGGYNIVEFNGSMGAGKTTLIKELCGCLGVEDSVTSPTFAIVNEYLTASNDRCYHFDFYRINKLQEVLDMGYEEYFYSGNLCLIEWPELIAELLPKDDVHIKILKIDIKITGDSSRIISISAE